jgi:hypothetical protein
MMNRTPFVFGLAPHPARDVELIDDAMNAGDSLSAAEPELLVVEGSHATPQGNRAADCIDFHFVRAGMNPRGNEIADLSSQLLVFGTIDYGESCCFGHGHHVHFLTKWRSERKGNELPSQLWCHFEPWAKRGGEFVCNLPVGVTLDKLDGIGPRKAQDAVSSAACNSASFYKVRWQSIRRWLLPMFSCR